MKQRRKAVLQLGVFDLGDGKQLIGTLELAREKTLLSLHSTEFLTLVDIPDAFIIGSLNDLTKVSLIDCVPLGTGSISTEEGRRFSARAFPHYVVSGKRHLNPNQQNISRADFVVDDATILFYDFDAFGVVMGDVALMSHVLAGANRPIGDRVVGDGPCIQYFTGKRNIVSAETVIGKVSVYHAPMFPFPGPAGVRIKNTIRVAIDFPTLVGFQHAIDQVLILRNHFGLLVGRPQKIKELHVHVVDDRKDPIALDVYWSWRPSRKKSAHQGGPHQRLRCGSGEMARARAGLALCTYAFLRELFERPQL